MDYASWEPYYLEIISDMGYSLSEDEEAAVLLDELILQGREEGRIEDIEETISLLQVLLKGKKGYVFGGGPNLGTELEMIRKMELFKLKPWKEYVPAADFTLTVGPPEWKKNMVPVSCDGATRAIMAADILPKVIVTDLDGEVEFQLEAVRKGAVLVVHGHGDNKESLRKWVPRMKGKVIPTCQCGPRGLVRNFGGFTDGDRAVYLMEAFEASSATLVGFDFKNVGEKTGPKHYDRKIKSRKLVWAELLIEMIRGKIHITYFNQLPVF